MMVRYLLRMLVILLLLRAQAWAVPTTVHYQGVLRDPATGKPRAAGSYDMTFRLWKGATGSQPADLLWQEARSVDVDARGLFSLDLGTVTPLTPAALGTAEAWFELTVGSETLTPRRRLTSVPYALKAGDAEALGGRAAADYVTKDALRPIVSVTDFGAKGNNIADDAAAIRTALAGLAATGGTLRFPPGRYKVGSTVEVTQNSLSLVGDNRNACVLVPTANTITPLRIKADGVRLAGLGFEGLGGTTGASGIEVASGKHGFIWDCYASNFTYGLRMHGDWQASPNLKVSDWNVARGDWSNNTAAGIYLHHCDSIQLSEIPIALPATANIYGVLVESGATGIYLGRINITGGSPLLVRDTLTPQAKPQNLYFNQFLADSSWGFAMQLEQAQNVTMVDCWAAGCNGGPGVVIGNQVSEMSLIACRLFGNDQEGVRVVSGNTEAYLKIEDCYIGSNSRKSAGSYDGIVIEPNVSHFIINGNGCWDGAAGQGSTQRYGIVLNTGCDNFIVTDNACRPNRTGGIYNLAGTSGTRIVASNLE